MAGASALAAAGLVTAGFAAPAMADDRSGDEAGVTESHASSELLGETGLRGLTDVLDLGPVSFDEFGNILGDVASGSVEGGDVATGDVSNESPVVVAPGDIGSGNSTGDIGSGNAIGSGNDVQAPIGSGNETNVDLGDVSDLVDVDSTVGDITGSVDGMVDDVTGSVDGIVEDVTSDLDLGLGGLLD